MVVPTLGRKRRALSLARQLVALRPAPIEVILVFQDPEEHAAAAAELAARTSGPPIHVRLEDRRSVTAARNTGAAFASGEFVIFIDDDCSPRDEDWLARLCRPLRADGGCVAATGPVLGWHAASRGMTFFGNAAPVVPLLCHPVGRPSARRGNRASTVWGGNFAVRRDHFLSVGGFRADVFGSPCLYEETEFSLRIRSRLSGTIRFVAEAVVVHDQDPAGGQRLHSRTVSPEFVGAHKRKLVACALGENTAMYRFSLVLNSVVFSFRYLLRGGLASSRGYLRGVWGRSARR